MADNAAAPWRPFRLSESRAHSALVELSESKASLDVRTCFESDPNRAEVLSRHWKGLLLDFSKQRLDADVLEALLELAREADIQGAIEDLFAGVKINTTEGRAVLHMALRANNTDDFQVDGQSVMPGVLKVRERMLAFAESIRDRHRQGQITDVVNIGIGGSDLGPAMAVKALRRFADGPACHFVSNVDGAHVESVLSRLNPRTTLLVVVSKTFTTQETMANARLAKQWLIQGGGNPATHMAAVSTNLEATGAFGIGPEATFGFEDWVGGRYSMWGPVGLSISIAIGAENFQEFLSGAREVDVHVQEAQPSENLPLLLALLGHWNQQVLGMSSHVVIPYAEDLSRLPAYLQQADMESNGKSITRSGDRVGWSTGSVVWGEPGTNSQHAFFQLLHQGTEIHPVDFLAFVEPTSEHEGMHDMLLANALAQAEALLVGQKPPKGQPHRGFEGNRPSTFWLFDALNPRTLGRLVAMHEHRIFIQGVLWGISSFDQWGVELGKAMANVLLPDVQHAGHVSDLPHDASTSQLLKVIKMAKHPG
ncbi:MAG: glucose-6-phosphate isomerase [Bacteroidetes bacterium]|nr:glucose-6-phosphate isomerase [Bacteroidota bacterium]MDA0902794.1 glucose-6-phosphate isomerase [Bacteroidota bacterium]MDA1242053.1 glucose-6-phosphate isomerase [Bacteroidota bacterium]